MKKVHAAVSALFVLFLFAEAWGADVRREVRFPDVAGYQTFACDLHMHTVFSDADVWPTVRVKECWRQGLDVMAITDHIEYHPHKTDVPTNHNRPYELMAGVAQELNLLLIKGAEITRDTPPGHFNAIFLQDIAPLDTPDFVEAVKRANEQGAFVFWNHQGWQGEEKGRWLDVHTTLYDNKWFQGMEVCNGGEYYPTAHQWCLEKNLTMLGNTDIHAPDLRRTSSAADHRTMTLVFAKKRTPEAIKDALLNRRTVVWYQEQLIGRQEWLEPLAKALIRINPPHLQRGKTLWVEIQNLGEADLHLQRTGDVGPLKATIPACSSVVLKVETATPDEPVRLSYTITNFLIAPKTGLPLTLEIPKP